MKLRLCNGAGDDPFFEPLDFMAVLAALDKQGIPYRVRLVLDDGDVVYGVLGPTKDRRRNTTAVHAWGENGPTGAVRLVNLSKVVQAVVELD